MTSYQKWMPPYVIVNHDVSSSWVVRMPYYDEDIKFGQCGTFLRWIVPSPSGPEVDVILRELTAVIDFRTNIQTTVGRLTLLGYDVLLPTDDAQRGLAEKLLR